MTAHLTTHPARHNRPVNDELHPLVYKSIVGLTIWLILSVWVLFNRGPYVGLNLLIVTVFFLIALGVPTMLWLSWRRNAGADEQNHLAESFRDWAPHEFVTWTGSVSGAEAAMQILLPIAAVAVGMTVFGLAFVLAVPNLG